MGLSLRIVSRLVIDVVDMHPTYLQLNLHIPLSLWCYTYELCGHAMIGKGTKRNKTTISTRLDFSLCM